MGNKAAQASPFLPGVMREGKPYNHAAGKVWDFVERPGISSTADSAEWHLTVVDGGADSAEVTTIADDEPNGALVLTTNDASADSLNLQLNGEPYKLVDGRRIIYEAKIKVSDADQVTWFVGLAIGDTTDALGGVTDSLGFRQESADGQIDALAEKDSTETSEHTGEDLSDDAYRVVRFEVDGVDKVEFYVDGVRKKKFTTNLPDDEAMAPIFQIQTEEAAANSLFVEYMLCLQDRNA